MCISQEPINLQNGRDYFWWVKLPLNTLLAKLNSTLGVPPISYNNCCPDSSWSSNSWTTSEKFTRLISPINSETDTQKQAGNPCWVQEINKSHAPGLHCINMREPMEISPWDANTKTVWERTKLRTGSRKKQRRELRTARKAKSFNRIQRTGTLWQAQRLKSSERNLQSIQESWEGKGLWVEKHGPLCSKLVMRVIWGFLWTNGANKKGKSSC